MTASHNPKADNGFKVYWKNGAQIIPPHDSGIAQSILKNLEPWCSEDIISKVDCYNLKKHGEMTQDVTDLVTASYFEECSKRYSYLSADDKGYDGLKVVWT